MIKTHFDVCVIGAGPAGMATAQLLKTNGASVCVLDEQASAGGQIYRSISTPKHKDKEILGPDYYYGEKLYRAFEKSNCVHLNEATVWQINPEEGTVYYSQKNQSKSLNVSHIIVATGAQERPMPFEGWNLPGVMTCGAGQILLKSNGISPSEPVVLCGAGPLLFLIAKQFIQAGTPVKGILETTQKTNTFKALRHWQGALSGFSYIKKGVDYIRFIKKAGVPILSGVSNLKAEENEQGLLSSLNFTHKGRHQKMDTKLVMTHQGVIPNVQMTRALDCEHVWDDIQHYWKPKLNEWGETSLKNIYVVGDGSAINGARAAEHLGRLSAAKILHELQKITSATLNEIMKTERQALNGHISIRPFLDQLYAPLDEFLNPSDETMICRCEEVKAKDIRDYVRLGCLGPNQTKAYGRSGMGPCQGRQCGLAVSEIIQHVRDVPMEEVGYYNIRFPIKPVTMGELAQLADAAE